MIAKNRILQLLQNLELMLISLFNGPIVPNMKALTWKMASEMTKIQKSVIGSVCTYSMSCKAHYRYLELGALDE